MYGVLYHKQMFSYLPIPKQNQCNALLLGDKILIVFKRVFAYCL